MHISRRSLLKATAIASMASLLRPTLCFAAQNNTSGSISVRKLTPATGGEAIETLIFTPDGATSNFMPLTTTENTPVQWTLRNETAAPISVRLQGIRATLNVDGKRVDGALATIAPNATTTLEFTPPDAGTYYAAIASEKLTGTVPIIVNGASPKFEHDLTISINDQTGSTPALQYFVNNSQLLAPTFSQGALVRVRLLNTTRNSLMPFVFAGGLLRIIAFDGHAIEPYEPYNGRVTLSPGQRADVAVFIPQSQMQSFKIDTMLGATPYPLFTAQIQQSLREKIAFHEKLVALPPAKVPDRYPLEDSVKVDWKIDEAPAKSPLFSAKRGQTIVLTLNNPRDKPVITLFEGHCMRPLDLLDDGIKPYVRDAVVLKPKLNNKYAFVANLEGTWAVRTFNVTDGMLLGEMKFAVV